MKTGSFQLPFVFAMLLALFAALGGARSARADDMDVWVWVTSEVTPDPVLSGHEATVDLEADADTSDVNEEALEDGAHWAWSNSSPKIFRTLGYWDNPTGTESATASVAQMSIAPYSARLTFSGTAGLWEVNVQANCDYTDGSTIWSGVDSVNVDFAVQDMIVTFNRDARPGITTDINHSRKDRVTVSIQRGDTNGNLQIDFNITSNNMTTTANATVTPGSYTLADGIDSLLNQPLDIDGTSQSGFEWDLLVMAKRHDTNDQLAEDGVTVTIPANWTDDAIGGWISSNTIVVENVPGTGWCDIIYNPIVFTVQDQFSQTLSSVWDGVKIQENGNGHGWVGFSAGASSTDVTAAHATDQVRLKRDGYANQADAIADTSNPFQNVTIFTVPFTYQILDGTAATYSLDGTNTRSHGVLNGIFSVIDTK